MIPRIWILLATAMLATASAWAQQILTASSLPSRPLQYKQIVDRSRIEFDSGGRARVWNYSDIGVGGRERIVSHLAPSSLLPSVLSVFPATQVAVQIDSTLTLYATVGQFFRQLGTVTPNTQTAVVIDPYDTRPTEIVYSGRIIDAHRAAVRINITPPYTGTRRGQSTTSYDAAGTLLIPGARLDNIARLNTMMVTVDTIGNGIQTLVVRTETRRLTFQQVDNPIIYLDHSRITRTVTRNGVVVAPPDTSITTAYFNGPITSVEDVIAGPQPSVTPNPVVSDLIVVRNVFFVPSTIELLGTDGGIVSIPDWNADGTSVLRVTMPAVANGAYSMRLYHGDGRVISIPVIVVR